MKKLIWTMTFLLLSGCVSIEDATLEQYSNAPNLARYSYAYAPYASQQFGEYKVSYHFDNPRFGHEKRAEKAKSLSLDFYKQAIFIYRLVPVDSVDDPKLEEAASLMKKGLGMMGSVIVTDLIDYDKKFDKAALYKASIDKSLKKHEIILIEEDGQWQFLIYTDEVGDLPRIENKLIIP